MAFPPLAQQSPRRQCDYCAKWRVLGCQRTNGPTQSLAVFSASRVHPTEIVAGHACARSNDASDCEARAIVQQDPAVLECRHGELLTLLSLHTGRYHTLNALSAFIWEHLAGGATPADLARAIHAAFDTTGVDVDGDVVNVLAEFRASGLVASPSGLRRAPWTAPRAQRPATSVSYASVALTLARVRCLLRTRGLLSAARFAYQAQISAVSAVGPSTVRQVVDRVNRVATLAPFRAECLERSLTVAATLRRLGADATVRLAIRHFPFEAHAWTELAGTPINEADAVCALYEPFPALGRETLTCSR